MSLGLSPTPATCEEGSSGEWGLVQPCRHSTYNLRPCVGSQVPHCTSLEGSTLFLGQGRGSQVKWAAWQPMVFQPCFCVVSSQEVPRCDEGNAQPSSAQRLDSLHCPRIWSSNDCTFVCIQLHAVKPPAPANTRSSEGWRAMNQDRRGSRTFDTAGFRPGRIQSQVCLVPTLP